MYPNLYYFFREALHIELPFLRVINTFGFLVALSFLTAAFILQKELKRKEQLGLLLAVKEEIWEGKRVSFLEYFWQGLIGFIFGFKLIGLFQTASTSNNIDAQQYLLSTRGSWVGGILLGMGFIILRVQAAKKEMKKCKGVPRRVQVIIRPHQRIGDMAMIAFIGGFIGAKIFHNLENWRSFIDHPIKELFSFGGLTFYGGLIVAGVAMLVYAHMRKLNPWVIADCFAPVMMAAYAVGRLGCQFSGDGDWGILNSAYVSDIEGRLFSADAATFQQALINNHAYYTWQFESIDNVKHIYFNPSWLPQFLKAQNYLHNVLNEGFALPDCTDSYCHFLPIGVFPTPLYEFAICALLFVGIWYLRTRIQVVGYLIAVYLILAGLERFFIEKIRVNTLYKVGSWSFTQAELISTLIIISGIGWIIYHRRRWQRGQFYTGERKEK